MSSDWYLINKSKAYYSGYETDQFNLLSSTSFNELLSISPEAYDVTINGTTKKVIIQHANDSDKRVILTNIGDSDIGDSVVFDNKNWLVIEYPTNDKLNNHSEMQLCNNTLSFTGQPIKTKIGTEPSGAPIYDEEPGQTYSYPCIVQTVTDVYDGSTMQVNIPDTKLTLIIQNVDNADLKVDLQFQMYGNNYKIYGFDRSKTLNDKGLLYIFADKV